MKLETVILIVVFISLISCQQKKSGSEGGVAKTEKQEITISKLSPNELISKIQQKGHTVEKSDPIASIAQNSEVQFWIIVDGKRISAYRFESPELAEVKSESFEEGYSKGYWAFAYVDENTRTILEDALK